MTDVLEGLCQHTNYSLSLLCISAIHASNELAVLRVEIGTPSTYCTNSRRPYSGAIMLWLL